MMPIPPYSIASLAAIARQKGHEVEVWDQFATRERIDLLTDRLIENGPDLVGISCLTPSEPYARRIIQQYREKGGKGATVLGGVHPTVFHRELIEQGACDIVVRREGEGPFGDLLDAHEKGAQVERVKGITFRKNGEVVATEDHAPVGDLDALPVPAWECLTQGIEIYGEAPTLGLYGSILPILGARGCPFRCTFCGQEVLYPGVRTRSVHNIIEEIRYLRERFGLKNFVFLDANFPLSRKQGMTFCDAMIESGLAGELRWSAEVAVSMVDREMIHKMAEAGCRNIEYGFEVGSPEILEQTRKGTTIEQAVEAMQWTKEAGIHVFGLFMIGLPGETPGHIRQTLRLAVRLDSDIAKFNVTVPYPGSALFEDYREELMRDFDPETFNPWFQSDDPGRKVSTVPGGMSANKLLFYQRAMMLLYYVRPRMILKHIRQKTLRPAHFLMGIRFLFGGLFESVRKIVHEAVSPSNGRINKGRGRK